jgi:MFS family permease
MKPSDEHEPAAAVEPSPEASAGLGTFRSLAIYNYRLWAAGSLVSNVGTWMQRTAQDWLVLTQLTNKNGAAVGVVMALQFGPQLLMLPLSGYAADRFDRRKVVFVTQAAMGVLALGLGLLTVTGIVRLWHVYVFAFSLGCVSAFDSPARQAFVSELVGEGDLGNAVGLSSASFNGARLIGPAVAGVLIAAVGSGWVFLINAASFAVVLVSILFLRIAELHVSPKAHRGRAGLVEGFRYVWRRPDLLVILVMVFLVGTFGLNFPIFLSTMSAIVFHQGARAYGVLSSILAIGSVTGALLTATRKRSGLTHLIVGALAFGVGFSVAAVMPTYVLFALPLVLIGVAAQTFTTSANSTLQVSTEPAMRGRVVAIFLAIALGGTPVGAPLIGWIADRFGPRWALSVGAAAGFGAAAVGLLHLARQRHARRGREVDAGA